MMQELFGFVMRFGSGLSSARDALDAVADAFPEIRLAPANASLRGLDFWELSDLCLRGRIHPLTPCLDVLHKATKEDLRPDQISWALAEASHWVELRRVANEYAYLFGHADFGNTSSLRDLFLEVEVLAACKYLWPAAAALPCPRSGPKPDRGPEFFLYVDDVGALGVEAKHISPMNDHDLQSVSRAARVASAVVDILWQRRIPVLLEVDLGLIESSTESELITQMVIAAERAADGGVLEVDKDTTTPGGALKKRRFGNILTTFCGGLRHGRIHGVPTDALALECWWNAADVPGSLEANEAEEQGVRVIAVYEPRECAVTVRGAVPDISERVRRNVKKADKKFGNGVFGLSWLRASLPPFALPAPRYLESTWKSAVLPAMATGDVRRTSGIVLSMLHGTRIHPTTTRQRRHDEREPRDGLQLTRRTLDAVTMEAVFGEASESVPEALFAPIRSISSKCSP